MRVICAHAGTVHALTAAALGRHAPAAEYIDTSGGGDDRAYGRLIASWWNQGDDLVIVEHDIEITAEVLPAFSACREPWCVFAYEIFPPPLTTLCEIGFGCIRWTAEFQARFDFAGLLSPCRECGNLHSRWQELDAHHAITQRRAGLAPHVHGTVRHFHPYQDAATFAAQTEPGVCHFSAEIRNVTRPRR